MGIWRVSEEAMMVVVPRLSCLPARKWIVVGARSLFLFCLGQIKKKKGMGLRWLAVITFSFFEGDRRPNSGWGVRTASYSAGRTDTELEGIKG